MKSKSVIQTILKKKIYKINFKRITKVNYLATTNKSETRALVVVSFTRPTVLQMKYNYLKKNRLKIIFIRQSMNVVFYVIFII